MSSSSAMIKSPQQLPSSPPLISSAEKNEASTFTITLPPSSSASSSGSKASTESYRGATDRLQERLDSRKFISKFKLPSDEILINDWTCALSKAVLLQGRLYLSQNYLCFHSKIFGTDTKEVIKLSDIQAIKKRNKFVIGIEVFMKNGTGRYLFCSFLTRSRTYKVIMDAWTKKAESLSSSSSSSSLLSTSPQLTTSLFKDTDESDAEGASTTANNNGTSGSSSDAANDGGSSSCSDSEMTDIDSMLTKNCNEDREGFLSTQPGTETIPQMVVPFTPVQFFYLFLSEKSEEFERQLKCFTPRLSLVIDPWRVSSEYNGMMVREMRSTVSLADIKAPVGTDKSRVVETQRYVLTKDMLILQIRSHSLDIPYSDCFHTESEMILTKVSPTASSLVGKGGAAWVKRSLLKGIIESTTIKQMKSQTASYIEQTKQWGEDKQELLARIERYVMKSDRKHGKQAGSSSSKQNRGKDISAVSSSSSSSSYSGVGSDVAKYGIASGNSKTTSLTVVGTAGNNNDGYRNNHIVVIVLLCLIMLYLVSKVISLERKLDRVNSIMMSATQRGKNEL